MREDVREVLRQWDDGHPVRMVELGGMGPGYEQVIQILVMELLRADLPVFHRTGDDEKDTKSWYAWGEEVCHRVSEQNGGMSGAQVGAARSMALTFMKRGFEDVFKELRKNNQPDRVILVSKFWPGQKPVQEKPRYVAVNSAEDITRVVTEISMLSEMTPVAVVPVENHQGEGGAGRSDSSSSDSSSGGREP